MRKLIAALLFFVGAVSMAQSSTQEVNNYKYVIVPKQFAFMKEPDEFQIGTFTKMYLEKYGFKAFFPDEVPFEAGTDNCNRIFADLVVQSNMFITKMEVVLRDCTNKELYRSDVGKSKDKVYKVAYRQALREAFRSFDGLGYQYNGGDGISGRALEPNTQTTMPVGKQQPKPEVIVDKNTLFAQPIENGYQLVDTTPKVIYKLKKTSSSQVFLADKDGVSGTMIEKSPGKWVFEYYVDGNLVTENVSIKF